MTPREILIPDAHDFADVLEYLGEWDAPAWNHYRGEIPHPETRPAPRYLDEQLPLMRNLLKVSGLPVDERPRNTVGPFCTVETKQRRHRSIAVRATDATMAALSGRDTLSFRVIEHPDGRVLVTCCHNQIIGSHWLAFVELASLPPYPLEARDARYQQVCDALREQGHTPFVRHLPGFIMEVGSRTLPGRVSRIEPNGFSTETWPDGSTTITRP